MSDLKTAQAEGEALVGPPPPLTYKPIPPVPLREYDSGIATFIPSAED